MKTVFDFDDYKLWIRHWIEGLPKKGRGQLSKLAQAAQIFPSSLSQVLGQGNKHLTLEQAVLVADHVGLSEAERKFFLLLVQRDRAGSVRLRHEIERQVRELQQSRLQLSNRLSTDSDLNQDQGTIFYSNWMYGAMRVLSSISSLHSLEALAQRLQISRAQAKSIMDFLIGSGLCIEKNGKIEPGPKHTHLEATSPLVSRHHANWRLKGMERHVTLKLDSELAYSSPVSLSRADAAVIREELVRLIERFREVIDPSPPEAAYCLNVDWFEF